MRCGEEEGAAEAVVGLDFGRQRRRHLSLLQAWFVEEWVVG